MANFILQTLLRSAFQWHALRRLDARVCFHILTDDNSAAKLIRERAPLFVSCDVVPATYRPANARYKARALEWFRCHWKVSKDDWVLHLDEETMIDEYALQTCIDFIERGTEDIGMVDTASF